MLMPGLTKVAIIPFPDLQKQTVTLLGSFIAEELTTDLFTTGKFQRLTEVGNDPWLFSPIRTPSVVFSDVVVSGV